ncbi:MAG: fluoride efflux transporter CrcB [Candidatus Binataceae bacterium]
MAYLLVAMGGALGSMARYGLSGFVGAAIGETFPWGTLFVNVTGALIIGFVASLTGPDGRILVGAPGRQFVMTGICGGYTTFSTFSLETLNLIRGDEWGNAFLNMGLSLAVCLLAVWLGHIAALGLSRLQGG